jgi:ABC-2 type transport system permease protein
MRIISLTKRNIKEILREPISLVFMLALPILMEILFYFLFHNLTKQFEMKYLAPAMIGFANSFISLFVAMLVASDRESSFITRIYTTPVKPYEFIISYLLSVIPFGVCQSVLILLIGGLIDFSVFSVGLLLVLCISLLSIIMFASIGILLGSLFNSKAVGGVASILISGQSVLSGMWFPLDGISKGFITFMDYLPFRNISVLFQNIAMLNANNPFNDIWFPIIVISAYTLVSVSLSCVIFIRNSKSR